MLRAAPARTIEPVSIICMADSAPTWRIERAVPLKPGKIPSLTSGKPSRVAVLARGDAPVAGERKLEAATQAEAVDGAHHRHRQALDAIEEGVDEAHAVDDLPLTRDLFELAHVGADDEALFLARAKHQPVDTGVPRTTLDIIDDLRPVPRAAAGRANSGSRPRGRTPPRQFPADQPSSASPVSLVICAMMLASLRRTPHRPRIVTGRHVMGRTSA